MKRTLLVLATSEEVTVCLGSHRLMSEICRDQVDENTDGFKVKIDGPSTCIMAIEVAWAVGDEIMPNAHEGPDTLQALILKAIELGATHHEKFLPLFEKGKEV